MVLPQTEQITAYQKVLVIDLGSQYTQLIARKIREQNVYCEIMPYSEVTVEIIKRKLPIALVLSGGPASVYKTDAPKLADEIFSLGIPILGICYGMQLGCQALGGNVISGSEIGAGGEFGRTELCIEHNDIFFENVGKSGEKTTVWMSHRDRVENPGEQFIHLASTPSCPYAAVKHKKYPFYGIQFHTEVNHTIKGRELLRNFLFNVCKAKGDWLMTSFIETTVEELQRLVKADERVIVGLSGGVDSSVVTALLYRALGDRVSCIYVDNGLMREGENAIVKEMFGKHFKTDLHIVNAGERFLTKLAGITDPEQKRIIIGHEFIRVFEDEARKIKNAKFLAQGTLYPDVIESVPAHGGPTATIKRHHNVGGLPDKFDFQLIEPLRHLFKDEVRVMGTALGLPEELVWRQPFPGPGLAVRIIGDVTHEKCVLLRKADTIVLQEIRAANLYRKVWQAFAVLLPVKSVGVMGDERTYENIASIRIVESVDAMTADWARVPYEVLDRIARRIINEVRGFNRVVYDISSKPPATIEYE